jgi:multicomponent Na+:H+ antiporter subunit C
VTLEILLALIIGVLYASGLYMMLRRSVVKLVIGLALLAHATNLLVFTGVGLTRGQPPLVPEGATVTPPGVADPLAQALVLTAIVISFGLLVFTVVLLYRAYQAVGSPDLDAMRSTEE